MSKAGIQRGDFMKFEAAAAATIAPVGCALANHAGKQGKRPNVIYVFSDEHRWQSMPFTMEPHMITPNMERLAAEGMSLDNCCSTSPICVPYRAMLMTGQWPHQSGYVSNHWYGDGKSIGINSPTIGHAFKQAGYKTGYVGKWHLMNETCKNAGFDFFKHWLYGDEHWATEVRDIPSGGEFETVEGYNAIGMTDQAFEFMDDASTGEDPFFLMLSLNPPHWRWDDAPEEYMKLYPDDNMTFPPNVEEKYKTGRERFYFQNYQAHITGIDVQLGRIMDYLMEKGIEEDTILVYSSDHGSSFGSNGVGSKANPYEESIRIPFIVRWPGHVPAGQTADQNVGTMDMFPTLCGLAGISATAECGGEDFAPVLLGQPGPDPETQFLCVNSFPRNYFRNQVRGEHQTYFCPFRGVRSKQYSYVFNAAGEWFLYDNKNDPYQLENLVDDPNFADVKEKMQKELDAWLAKAEDPYIPEEWKKLPLPERIAVQNRYYTVEPFTKEWNAYKADALKPTVAQATPAQAEKLQAAADRVFDEDFFGLYKALSNELKGKKRKGVRPLREIKIQLAAHEEKASAAFKAEADQIL